MAAQQAWRGPSRVGLQFDRFARRVHLDNCALAGDLMSDEVWGDEFRWAQHRVVII